jgi:regulator of ribonuclease activity A
VVTLKVHEDNALVRSTLETPGDGNVLVVDGGGSLGTALMGDMIAESAVANGWAGVVINGAIRDREAIAALDLGVKALGSNPRKSAKAGAGEVDVDVQIDGVTIRSGTTIWCDPDGILVER